MATTPPRKKASKKAAPQQTPDRSTEERVAVLEQQVLNLAQAIAQLAVQVAGPAIQQQLSERIAEQLKSGQSLG